MKALTQMEIEFIRDTCWKPTITQCDEWAKCNINSEDDMPIALVQYGLELDSFYDKFFGDDCLDSISFCDEMTYILATFYEYEDIVELMDNGKILEVCKDWKYYFGARKWSMDDAMVCAGDALAVLRGELRIWVTEENDIMILQWR